MKIKLLGHSAFLITSDSGVRIITDPYQSGGFNGGIEYKPIRETADIVTISHEHSDHNYVKDIGGNPEIIRKTDEREVKGIKIAGTLTCHDKTSGRQRGLNTVFCVTVDGIRVCHLGDLGHELSAKEIKAIGDVDVLLIPVGGYFTIDAAEAFRTVNALNPKIVIPMHYKTPAIDFPIAEVDEFAAKMKGYSVKRLAKSEVEVDKAGMLHKIEVWILQHAP